MKNHIIKIKNLLERHKIKYWLDFGSLLGAVREGDIIENDKDFDFSIWYENKSKLKLFYKDLSKIGYKIIEQKNLPWLEDLVQIYLPVDEKTNFHIDIYIYKQFKNEACMRRLFVPSGVFSKLIFKILLIVTPSINDTKLLGKKASIVKNIYNYLTKILPNNNYLSNLFLFIYGKYGRTIWLVSPVTYFNKFSKIKLFSTEFYVPKNYKKYLSFRYGDNWISPDPNFDTRKTGGRIERKIHNSWELPFFGK